jgi:hypothetical protein
MAGPPHLMGSAGASLRPDKPPRGASGHLTRRSTPRANRHRVYLAESALQGYGELARARGELLRSRLDIVIGEP